MSRGIRSEGNSGLATIATIAIVAVVSMASSSGSAWSQQACRPLPSGVVAWWPGDGTANDLTPSANHGQLINGATFAPGAVGSGFLFDGVNDRIDVPDAPALRPQTFTLATWFRQDAASAQTCLICKQYGSGDANSFSLWLASSVLRGGMFRYAEAIAPSAVPLGQMTHAAVTFDGSIIRLYIDGKIVATAAGPATPLPYDTNQVILGADDQGVGAYGGFFTGIIDEAQIFGRALSDCEIRALYAAWPAGSCEGDSDADSILDFVDNCPGVSNAAQMDTDADGVGDACDCAPADPTTFANPGDRNELGFVSHEGVDWCRDPSLTGPSTVYDVLRGDLAALPVTTATSTCRSRCIPPVTGVSAWWPGDSSTVELIAGNNGTLDNGAGYGPGWVRDAFLLDGVNDRVHTGNLTLGNTFSVTTWVNSDVINQGAYHRILENNYTTDFELGTDGTGAGFKFIVKNAAAPYGLANGGKISPGNWQFVAGTYDGTTGTLYVDGKPVGADTFVAPGTVSLPLYFGAYFAGGGAAWKGRMDETQVFNRTLTAAEIVAMYEAGSAGQCKAALGGTDAQWTVPWAADSAVPAPGHGFWYVYRGRNACGVGSYGFRSNGAERISTACN